MTPLQFESACAPAWAELESLAAIARASGEIDAARLTALYRRVCEHLALAQARSYPVHLTQRLEQLVQRVHQLIYGHRDFGVRRFSRLVLVEFPQAVRAHRAYLLVAALLFLVPLLAAGFAAYRDQAFILRLLDVEEVQRFDVMYSDSAGAFGSDRGAGADVQMFSIYVMHNIGIAFRCFAAGLFAGVGSAFILAFNGVMIGAVGGYLIAAGHGGNFSAFVVTHSAFELTAIVLAGAAGLRLGFSWMAPGQHTRLEALRRAARAAVVVVYGVMGMLLAAAAIEAFWSSAVWIDAWVKYAVGACCWGLVLAYLGWQGRPRRSKPPAPSRAVAIPANAFATATTATTTAASGARRAD